MSTAGAAVPVLSDASDTAPTGWMARLEAARMIASGRAPVTQSQGVVTRRVSAKPVRPSVTQATSVPGQSAQMLVAQLEREESQRERDEAARMQSVFEAAAPEAVVAQVQVDVPVVKPARRLPEWVWGALIVAAVSVGLGYAYTRAQSEPNPLVEVDPQRVAAAARQRRALTALQAGHQAVRDEAHDRAIRHYREALRLNPDLASAERGLGIAYAAKGDGDRALKHYRNFVELEPDGLEAAKVKALIRDYVKKKRRRGAR